jgi:hypothetical protein
MTDRIDKIRSKNRYLKVLGEARKDFPELGDTKINLKIGKIWFSFMWVSWSFGRYTIKMDPFKLKNVPDKVIKAIFAHELSHCLFLKKVSLSQMLLHGIKYYTSPSYYSEHEKDTDKLAILRGYAREMYLGRKILSKRGNRLLKVRIKKSYLSPFEIKEYAKSIGKW